VVAHVDDGTELWRLGSMSQSDWTDPLKLFELIVSMSQSDWWVIELSCARWGPIQPTVVLVVWSVDRSRSGFSAHLVVWSIDQSCMVFRPGFPYKLGQLSSSNKNSGKQSFHGPFKKSFVLVLFIQQSWAFSIFFELHNTSETLTTHAHSSL
jgi:hypothetical protein